MNKTSDILTHFLSLGENDTVINFVVKAIDEVINFFESIHHYYEFKKHKKGIEEALENMKSNIKLLVTKFVESKQKTQAEITKLEDEIKQLQLMFSSATDHEKIKPIIADKQDKINKLKESK